MGATLGTWSAGERKKARATPVRPSVSAGPQRQPSPRPHLVGRHGIGVASLPGKSLGGRREERDLQQVAPRRQQARHVPGVRAVGVCGAAHGGAVQRKLNNCSHRGGQQRRGLSSGAVQGKGNGALQVTAGAGYHLGALDSYQHSPALPVCHNEDEGAPKGPQHPSARRPPMPTCVQPFADQLHSGLGQQLRWRFKLQGKGPVVPGCPALLQLIVSAMQGRAEVGAAHAVGHRAGGGQGTCSGSPLDLFPSAQVSSSHSHR